MRREPDHHAVAPRQPPAPGERHDFRPQPVGRRHQCHVEPPCGARTSTSGTLASSPARKVARLASSRSSAKSTGKSNRTPARTATPGPRAAAERHSRVDGKGVVVRVNCVGRCTNKKKKKNNTK